MKKLACNFPPTLFGLTKALFLALLITKGGAKADDVSATNYLAEKTLASFQHLKYDGLQVSTQNWFGYVFLTNLYPAMLVRAGEPAWIQPPKNTRKNFRWSWAGTSMNPGWYVGRFEIGETNSILTATFYTEETPSAEVHRGSRELTKEEHQQLRHAVDKFIAGYPLDMHSVQIDINPELFEYRDDERHLLAIDYGNEAEGVLQELHRLCWRAVRKTSKTQVERVSARPSSIERTNRTSSPTGAHR